MGSEAFCTVRYGDQVSTGKALLETSELLFRGGFRLKIPFSEITSLRSREGTLEVEFGGGSACFELGRVAEAWAGKIRNPRGLLDKLGVKAGSAVAVEGVWDDDFTDALRSRAGALQGSAGRECDLLFYKANAPSDLSRLSELRPRLKPTGGLWVVSPKGKDSALKDVEVITAARAAGLVDTKVVSFSATHTALKLVIPRDRR